MGRHSLPKFSVIRAISDSRLISAASILLTTIMRLKARSRADSMIRGVFVPMPERASMTTATDSTEFRAGSARPMKSG